MENKTVLTVGGSISGVDISADVCQKAAKVYHQFNKPFFVIKHFQESPVKTQKTGYEPRMKIVPADLVSKNRAGMLVNLPSNHQERVRFVNERLAARCKRQ